jgi:MFS family permease
MSESVQWRVMFLIVTILPSAMIYLSIKVMAETPRWYVLKDRYDEAKSVLQRIYPPGYNVDSVVEDIKEALERDRFAEKNLGWRAVFFPTAAFRRTLIVGCGIAIAQQAVGIDAIQYYLLDVLEQTIEEKPLQNIILIILGIIKLVCIFIGGKLFDSRGRRPLVYISLIGTYNIAWGEPSMDFGV